jgi:hypothetical protein
MSGTFPDGWPCGCPPDSAEDAAGEVFRIVKNDPPVAKDFETHHEAGKLPKADPCLRCGVSVFRVIEDAQHQRELFPKLGDQIAAGKLHASHGKAKLTEGRMPSHTTWWPYTGADRAALFVVVRVP